MKIFISSLITGMEDFRRAAKEAVLQLGHEPVMAEDFGAKAHSPQIACLDGVRKSGLVILIVGESYGSKQPSGISATHEEYREAKEKHPVMAFVQNGVTRATDQSLFLKEVQDWALGLFREGFDTPENLKVAVTKAIHEWQLSTAVTPLDTNAITQSAISSVMEEYQSRSRNASLIVAISGGPIQSILRPSQIEKKEIAEELLQGALFGQQRIFSTQIGSKNAIQKDSLVIEQDDRSNLIKLDPQGGILLRLKLPVSRNGMVLIQDDLEKLITSALRYAFWILEKIDNTQRLTHLSIAMMFSESNRVLIRTKAEDDASPNSFNIGFGYNSQKNQPVTLKPAHRTRASLNYEAETIAEDFVTLLKRGTT